MATDHDVDINGGGGDDSEDGSREKRRWKRWCDLGEDGLIDSRPQGGLFAVSSSVSFSEFDPAP